MKIEGIYSDLVDREGPYVLVYHGYSILFFQSSSLFSSLAKRLEVFFLSLKRNRNLLLFEYQMKKDSRCRMIDSIMYDIYIYIVNCLPPPISIY